MMKDIQKPFKLRQMLIARWRFWLLAWAIGLITFIAVVGLLALSGWFISASAFAGIVCAAAAYNFNYFSPAGFIRFFAIVRTVGRYGERLASHAAVLSLLTDLRRRFFAQISLQPLNQLTPLTASTHAMHRLISDIESLNRLPLHLWAPWLWSFLMQGLFFAFIAIYAAPLVVSLSIPFLITGVVIPLIGQFWGIKMARDEAQLSELRRQNLVEPLGAITALIMWQRWSDNTRQFATSDDAYSQSKLRQHRRANLLVFWQHIWLTIAIFLLLYQAPALLNAKVLSVALLLAILLMIFAMYEIILPTAQQFMAYGYAAAARERLNLLGANCSGEFDADDDIGDARCAATFAVEDLSAKLPQAFNGIANINFKLNSGEVLLINGRSGGGKSTLLYALAGELPLTNGKINYGGKIIDNLPRHCKVGFLAQQIDIFDLTLAQNLRLAAADASDEQLWQVLADVALADWARAQPQQLETQLGEYGAAISGGQARRIALARLLLNEHDLLLLDEPFAGLDEDNCSLVYAHLCRHQKDKFLLIVSHKLPANCKAQIMTIE